MLKESLDARGKPSGKYPVALQKSWKAYNAGEVAGFDLATATALCANGIATPYGETGGEIAVAPEPEPEKSKTEKKGKPKPVKAGWLGNDE